MEPSDFPAELRELERRLSERPQPQPSAAFRERVLASMRVERGPRRTAWQIAAVAAAVLLLIFNLALSLSNQWAFYEIKQIQNMNVETTAHTLRQRHPELSEREAYQFALLLHSPPALPLSLPPLSSLEGEQPWDMR